MGKAMELVTLEELVAWVQALDLYVSTYDLSVVKKEDRYYLGLGFFKGKEYKFIYAEIFSKNG